MLRCIFTIVSAFALAMQAGAIDLTSPDGTVRCQIASNA
jgi:hypothetical protein